MTPLTRRSLIQAASAAAVLPALPSCSATPIPREPRLEDTLKVAVVGVRSRGNAHIGGFQSLPGVDVVALVDVDSKVLKQRAGELLKNKKSKKGWAGEDRVDTYADLRILLEREDIDIVSIATPNHLHAIQTIWSCQAGKDVYVEKPVCHNIFEGRQMVRASEKYGRFVQTGTQSRSSSGIRSAVEFLRAGELGEIRYAHGSCFKPRKSIGKLEEPQTVPDHVDWNLYCGPAPLDPLHRQQLHYDWHWQFQTGNGDLGNQGIHQVDLCRWALGEDALAPSVQSIGGRVGYDDDGDTPNSMVTLFDYGPAPLLFEVRGLPRDKQAQGENWGGSMDRIQSGSIGVTIMCERGYVLIPGYTSAQAFGNDGKKLKEWKGSTSHFANLIDAIRHGESDRLNAPIIEGHISSSLCHMANISYTLGRASSSDEIRLDLASDDLKAAAFSRLVKHLELNGVDLQEHPLTLGAALELNPETERFVDNEAANRLLTRNYREPFIVPKSV